MLADPTKFYLTGVAISFLISLMKIRLIISEARSIRCDNMAKVNMRLSKTTGNYIEGKNTKIGWILFILAEVFIAPLFSWLAIFLVFFGFFIEKDDTQLPDELRKNHFKFKYLNLTKEQAVESVRNTEKYLGVSKDIEHHSEETELEDTEDTEDPNTLEIEKNGWVDKYIINIDENTVGHCSHPDDYEVENDRVLEYKIKGFKVYVRCFESSIEGADIDKLFKIRDNVVMETDVTRDSKKDGGYFLPADVGKRLEELQKAVEWHELVDYQLVYFIMYRNPDKISVMDFRKILRQKLEDINKAIQIIKKDCSEIGVTLSETNNGYKITNRDKAEPNILKEKFKPKYWKKLKIDVEDLWQAKNISETMNQYLEKV